VDAGYTEDEMPVAFTEIGALIARDPALRGGRPILAGTGVSVRTIAIDSNRGLSPEEIAADRPPLSLAQIYAALAFYHANKREIDADIAAEEHAYEEGVRTTGLPLRS
jgi:uncharacterized protein (DUF433 family)